MSVERMLLEARIDALREAAGFVAAFDQDMTGGTVKFDRETVRRLAEGLRAMADSATRRLAQNTDEGTT